MSRRQQIVEYVRTTVDSEFDPDQHELSAVLDSVSLLQLISFIDQELGIPLDLPNLSLEMFTSVDTVLSTLESYVPEHAPPPRVSGSIGQFE